MCGSGKKALESGGGRASDLTTGLSVCARGGDLALGCCLTNYLLLVLLRTLSRLQAAQKHSTKAPRSTGGMCAVEPLADKSRWLWDPLQ